ncbi:MAG TPA: hypothetical protein VGK24_10115 [Candidatus Angelobacter sp.]|jgi:hypothetical protein
MTRALLAVLHFLAYVFSIVALPLIAFVLIKFAYSVFGRPYLRVWRIKRKRNTRQLKAAIRRGRKDEAE